MRSATGPARAEGTNRAARATIMDLSERAGATIACRRRSGEPGGWTRGPLPPDDRPGERSRDEKRTSDDEHQPDGEQERHPDEPRAVALARRREEHLRG